MDAKEKARWWNKPLDAEPHMLQLWLWGVVFGYLAATAHTWPARVVLLLAACVAPLQSMVTGP